MDKMKILNIVGWVMMVCFFILFLCILFFIWIKSDVVKNIGLTSILIMASSYLLGKFLDNYLD